jgi:hypothetical protein
MMELYSSVLGKDRGALGLLFEMNQLMGIIISFCVAFWAVTGSYHIENERFKELEWFVLVQAVMVWVSLSLCGVALWFFSHMNREINRRKELNKVVE